MSIGTSSGWVLLGLITQRVSSPVNVFGYTLTPLAGQPSGPITVPGDVASATLNADHTLMYVVTRANDGQSTVTVIDLVNGAIIGGPATISGQAIQDEQFGGNGPGGVVVDEDGNAYVTTTTTDGGTVITRMPAPDGSGMLAMSFGALNVVYPDTEDTNPLLPQEFSSTGGDPAEFDMNSLLSV